MVRRFSDEPILPMRALQIWQILISAARNRQILTYGILASMLGYERAGVYGLPWGYALNNSRGV
jgi:hypothetical protein